MTYECADYKTFLPTIPGSSVDAVITDPPFGIGYQNNYTLTLQDVLYGDSYKFDYSDFGRECYRIMKPDTAIFAYTGWSEYPDHFRQLQKCGFLMKEPLICQKRASGKTDIYGTFQSNADWIIFGHKRRFVFKPSQLMRNKRAGTIPNIGRKPVGEFKTRFPSCWFGEEFPYSTENPATLNKEGIFHPTVKSVEFIEWLIQISTLPGDTVLDPFAGSGTVAVACKKLGRQFIGCEIDRFHYNNSVERMIR